MKVSEFKLRAISTINSVIDTYFGSNTMVDKFINTSFLADEKYVRRNNMIKDFENNG